MKLKINIKTIINVWLIGLLLAALYSPGYCAIYGNDIVEGFPEGEAKSIENSIISSFQCKAKRS